MYTYRFIYLVYLSMYIYRCIFDTATSKVSVALDVITARDLRD